MKKSDLLITDNISGVNQILPHVNRWAWDLFLLGTNNNWTPRDVNMSIDIAQWKGGALSNDEKLIVKRCLGFFAGSESLVANNLLLNIFKYVTDPECRQYILRQTYEESLHNWTVVYCCDSLNLDVDEVYQAYSSIESIKAKDDFLMKITSDIGRNDFTTRTIEGKRELLRNLFTYYIICEGLFFYSGFAMLLSLKAQEPEKMPGIGTQIIYTLKDESCHIEFGTRLINRIKQQYPSVWNKTFEEEMLLNVHQAIDLEIAYAKEVLPRGILGLNADMFIDYVKYIASRRLRNLGMKDEFSQYKNPFAWMSNVIDLDKQRNFFETTVTNYSQEIEDDL